MRLLAHQVRWDHHLVHDQQITLGRRAIPRAHRRIAAVRREAILSRQRVLCPRRPRCSAIFHRQMSQMSPKGQRNKPGKKGTKSNRTWHRPLRDVRTVEEKLSPSVGRAAAPAKTLLPHKLQRIFLELCLRQGASSRSQAVLIPARVVRPVVRACFGQNYCENPSKQPLVQHISL